MTAANSRCREFRRRNKAIRTFIRQMPIEFFFFVSSRSDG